MSILLLAAWMVWFFMARISLFEVSQEIKITKEGSMDAIFPIKAKDRVQVSQNATIRVNQTLPASPETQNNGSEKSTDIPALVMKIEADERAGRIVVNVVPLDDTYFSIFTQEDSIPSGVKVQIEVEVERITPFMVVQRASRQYMNVSQALPSSEGPND
jgi:hypothetical protein